jgi:hypothetical protein
MQALLALLAAASTLYVAEVPTFGCNSSAEVAVLLSARSDAKAYQSRLASKMVYGQCIAIDKGAVVEAEVESGDVSVLRINARTDPPGYMVPAGDFSPRDKVR